MPGHSAGANPLEEMRRACVRLDADIRYHRAEGYFTAIVRGVQDNPEDLDKAKAVQEELKRLAGQFPGVICYCFDSFCTLLYAV